MKISKIYLDMDGVIADFNKKFFELYGVTPRDADGKLQFREKFADLIANGHFATLDMMPEGKELLDYLVTLDIPIEILSSTSNEFHYEAISKQKNEWLIKHNLPFKQNFVPGKKHKSKYASPDAILIDDTEGIIEAFNAAGGIGIHHTNLSKTLELLKNAVM